MKPTRTRARLAYALLILLNPLLVAVLLSAALIYSRVWEWPAPQATLVLMFGVLLNPFLWLALLFIVLFRMGWDGTALLYREGRFMVYKRLVWGRGLPHRTDIERLGALSVSLKRYPRDDVDPTWRTSFRPRVLVQNGASTIAALGEGLSVEEATELAYAVGELIGLGGAVEQAHRAERHEVD